VDNRPVLIHRPGAGNKLGLWRGSVGYNRRMPEPSKPDPVRVDAPTARRGAADDDKVICERCGAEMFRMHAVWRCPACRSKTDCCGW
jgi:hypothetical protein